MAKKNLFKGQTAILGFTVTTLAPEAKKTPTPKKEKKEAVPAKRTAKKAAKPKLSPLEKFYKENNGRVIEDDGSFASEDFKSYCRVLRNALRKEAKAKGFDDVTLKPNHYDMSGFFKKSCGTKTRYVYWSFNVSRYETPTYLDKSDCRSGFLYRTAEHERDFKGGYNHFCDLMSLCDNALELIEREERAAA